MTAPLCRDCAHYQKDWVFSILPPWDGHSYSECASPKRKIDPVSGEKRPVLCSTARTWGHLCGEAGAWFEAKKGKRK